MMAEVQGNRYFPADQVEEGCDFTGPIVPSFDETALYIPVFARCEVPEDVRQHARSGLMQVLD